MRASTATKPPRSGASGSCRSRRAAANRRPAPHALRRAKAGMASSAGNRREEAGMRALVCHAYGPIESLKLEGVPKPQPGPGEILVKVGAAGVSFAAMLGIQGKHQNKPPLPFVPGNEIAGEVVALGDGVGHLKVGQRVATGGSRGGFAEYCTTIAANAIPIPDALPYAEATNSPTLYPTAYGALRWKANLLPGEVLLVHGAGGG